MNSDFNHLTESPSPGIGVRAGLPSIMVSARPRGFRPGLSAFIVKYGGSVLWGTMVFFVVAIAASHPPRRKVALISVSIAVGVELFRLVHAPWLDGSG